MQLGADHGENSQCRMFTVIDPWHRRESAIPENCRKFLPRDAVLARYMSVIVCLSVRPSQACTVQKRLNIRLRK